METLSALLPAVVGVLVLAAVSTATLKLFQVPHPWAPLSAIVRGTLQLAAISLILAGVISNLVWIGVALVVMFTAATTVATRRTGWSWPTLGMMATTMFAGIATALTVIFVSGALEFTPRYVLALGAIVIGNSMSIATLTGRVFVRSVADHWDEVEGWLSVGATPRQSTLDLARRSVREALIPAIDQTRTTGLVVLPGSFVGAIFGGVSPMEAGRFQIVVLAGALAAGAITSVGITMLLGDIRTRPVPAA